MATQSSSVAIPSVAAWVIAILLAAFFAFAYIVGRDARTVAARAEATRIEQEDRSFCLDLGFALGSGGHARCITGISDIRRRQMEQWELDAAGLI